MKNSKEYSQKTGKLYRSLKRKYPKVKKAVYDEPTDAVVYGIISENISERAAQSTIKRFADYFVDLNELRVSLPEEIIEALRENNPVAKAIASALTDSLRSIFNEYNTVSLKGLKKIGKRPAKQALERLEGTSNFTVNYCILTALQSHAIPLTKKMIEHLKANELVHPNADEQEIEGFLARQISAANAYEFYALLRRESESSRAGARKKTVKKKTAKKSKKVKVKKKGQAN